MTLMVLLMLPDLIYSQMTLSRLGAKSEVKWAQLRRNLGQTLIFVGLLAGNGMTSLIGKTPLAGIPYLDTFMELAVFFAFLIADRKASGSTEANSGSWLVLDDHSKNRTPAVKTARWVWLLAVLAFVIFPSVKQLLDMRF